MDFTNTFTVNAGLKDVWRFMLDVEQVAPCVPGASITEVVDSTHYKGTIKVKLGAVQLSYRGEIGMVPEEQTRTITLRAKGTESRGQGNVSGVVVITMSATESGGSRVDIESHVDVTGRVAQFGRGIMQDVSNRLIRDFARCLEQRLDHIPTNGEAATASASDANSEGEPPIVEVNPETAVNSTSGGTPAAAPSPLTQPRTTQPTSPAGAQTVPETSIGVGSLVADLARARLARGLRAIADIIEPR